MRSPSLMTNQTISGDTDTVTDRDNNGGHHIENDSRLVQKIKVLELTEKVRDKKLLYLSIAEWILFLFNLFCLSPYYHWYLSLSDQKYQLHWKNGKFR